MEKHTNRVEATFVFPSPDALEAEARQLPTLDVAASKADDWPTQWQAHGVSLKLPPGFEEVESEAADQTTWRHADSSAISLQVHDGGEHCISFASADGVEVEWSDEGTFQIPLAGRTGKINLVRLSIGGAEFFYSSAQAGIRVGCSILILLVAPTRERRASLISIISTVALAER